MVVFLISHLPDDSESVLMVSSSIARAVWAQDFKLARTLIKTSTLARSHLQIAFGAVQVIDFHSFGASKNNKKTTGDMEKKAPFDKRRQKRRGLLNAFLLFPLK